MNNTGLNSAGPLTLRFFSIVNTIVLYNPQLVESEDAEPRIWRNRVYGGTGYTGGPTINYIGIFDSMVGQHL